MARKGRPMGGKNNSTHTVPLPKELYDQLAELAVGSGMTLTAVAGMAVTEGLAHMQIVEETITRKRIVCD